MKTREIKRAQHLLSCILKGNKWIQENAEHSYCKIRKRFVAGWEKEFNELMERINEK